MSDFRAHARIRSQEIYKKADADPATFRQKRAEDLHWFKRWNQVMQWDPPHVTWFLGGELNLAYNCLDRHFEGPRRNKAAIIREAEDGRVRTYTYMQLHREGNNITLQSSDPARGRVRSAGG